MIVGLISLGISQTETRAHGLVITQSFQIQLARGSPTEAPRRAGADEYPP